LTKKGEYVPFAKPAAVQELGKGKTRKFGKTVEQLVWLLLRSFNNHTEQQ
jgi:hypothetical protein